MEKTILIDNSPYSALYQKDNLVPILPFTNDEKDDQLRKVCDYLLMYFGKNEGNFQEVIKNHFRLREYEKFSTVKELIDKLYSDFI